MATVRLVEAISRLVRAFPPRNPLIIELNDALTDELSQKPTKREPTPVSEPAVSTRGEPTKVSGDCPVCAARRDASRAAMAKARAARKKKA